MEGMDIMLELVHNHLLLLKNLQLKNKLMQNLQLKEIHNLYQLQMLDLKAPTKEEKERS